MPGPGYWALAFAARSHMDANRLSRVLTILFEDARLAGRYHVFNALALTTSVLCELDRGQTLRQVYDAVMEVEGWWL